MVRVLFLLLLLLLLKAAASATADDDDVHTGLDPPIDTHQQQQRQQELTSTSTPQHRHRCDDEPTVVVTIKSSFLFSPPFLSCQFSRTRSTFVSPLWQHTRRIITIARSCSDPGVCHKLKVKSPRPRPDCCCCSAASVNDDGHVTVSLIIIFCYLQSAVIARAQSFAKRIGLKHILHIISRSLHVVPFPLN